MARFQIGVIGFTLSCHLERKFPRRPRSTPRISHLRLPCCQHGCPDGVLVITPEFSLKHLLCLKYLTYIQHNSSDRETTTAQPITVDPKFALLKGCLYTREGRTGAFYQWSSVINFLLLCKIYFFEGSLESYKMEIFWKPRLRSFFDVN